MTSIGSKLPVLPKRFTGSPNCRALMLGSMLSGEALDQFVKDACPLVETTLPVMRQPLRAWLFGELPNIHDVFSIREFEPETIRQLDPKAKLLLAEQLFDLDGSQRAQWIERAERVVAAGEWKEGDERWLVGEVEWFNMLRENMLYGLGGKDRWLIKWYISSSGQMWTAMMTWIRCIAFEIQGSARPEELERNVAYIRQPPSEIKIIEDGKGYRSFPGRQELAGVVINELLGHSPETSWQGTRLAMTFYNLRDSCAEDERLLSAPGKLQQHDPAIASLERILGWKFHISPPEKDQVNIAIDFGDTFIDTTEQK